MTFQSLRPSYSIATAAALSLLMVLASATAEARERGRSGPRGGERAVQRQWDPATHSGSSAVQATGPRGRSVSHEYSVQADGAGGYAASGSAIGPRGGTRNSEVQRSAEDGYQRDTASTSPLGGTRSSSVSRDCEQGAGCSSSVTRTGTDGQSVTREQQITLDGSGGYTRSNTSSTGASGAVTVQRTDDGFTRSATHTGPGGGTVTREGSTTASPPTAP